MSEAIQSPIVSRLFTQGRHRNASVVLLLQNMLTPISVGMLSKVEPRFYDRGFNDIPDSTINILCPGKSYSKLYGAESRFNNIPRITMKI